MAFRMGSLHAAIKPLYLIQSVTALKLPHTDPNSVTENKGSSVVGVSACVCEHVSMCRCVHICVHECMCVCVGGERKEKGFSLIYSM